MGFLWFLPLYAYFKFLGFVVFFFFYCLFALILNWILYNGFVQKPLIWRNKNWGMFGADMKMPYSQTIRSREKRGLVDWDYWDISFNYVFLVIIVITNMVCKFYRYYFWAFSYNFSYVVITSCCFFLHFLKF